MIITLSVINKFAINLIPFNRTLKHLFTKTDRVFMHVKLGISNEAQFTVI